MDIRKETQESENKETQESEKQDKYVDQSLRQPHPQRAAAKKGEEK